MPSWSPEQYRPDESKAMFTQRQLDVMFHVLNNTFGPSWELACERAMETHGMTRDEFIATFSSALRILTNA